MCYGPGSAAHRVGEPFALRRVRGTGTVALAYATSSRISVTRSG